MQILDEMEWLLDQYVEWTNIWKQDHNLQKFIHDLANETPLSNFARCADFDIPI